KSLHCHSCRVALWRSFVSVTGVNLNSNAIGRSDDSGPRAQRRAITTNIVHRAESRARDELEESEDLGGLDGIEEAAPPSKAPLPWYLQEDAASRSTEATSPQAARQRLPDLPEHSPPILENILQQVSVELGIDDLSLLDLRHLDPPPALGANLLMLFGTARSEKHLHVSADRLCRWLRSNYDLSPNADGLLGRNELKIKLRRKARKSRMMANVGASPTSLSADDGIRTDWVCVNVGRVEAAASAPMPKAKEDFVGFGSSTNRVNIVVQLFTEEKRAELDLETLWNGVLKSNAHRNAEAESDAPEVQNLNGAVLADQDVTTYRPPIYNRNPQSPLQSRGFHSVSAALRPSIRTKLLFGHRQAFALASSLEHLEHLTAGDIIEALGRGPKYNDRSSTGFLRAFYENIPRHRDLVHYEALLMLYSIGTYYQIPGYPVNCIIDLLTEIQVAGHRIPEHMYLNILRQALASDYEVDLEKRLPKAQQEAVLGILEFMQLNGYQFNVDEVLLLLNDSFCQGRDVLRAAHGKKGAHSRMYYNAIMRHRLVGTLDVLALPLQQSTYLRLLTVAANFGDWEDFWQLWGAVARNQVARSPEMYVLALERIAETGHQKNCIDALRNTVPMMETEDPAVSLEGDVARAVMKAVEVADPEASGVAVRQGSDGEWVRLWRKCARALRS
ncbi:hypothetical protein K490DRAFT_726, partial [Saccharata proteae CBS 121410]